MAPWSDGIGGIGRLGERRILTGGRRQVRSEIDKRPCAEDSNEERMPDHAYGGPHLTWNRLADPIGIVVKPFPVFQCPGGDDVEGLSSAFG